MPNHNYFLGTVSVLVGSFFLFIALSPLLFYIILGVIGLWLIDFGLKLRNMPPMIVIVRSWKNYF